MNYSNIFIYYRLLHSISDSNPARTHIQDVLIDLRDKAAKDLGWTDQQVQDFTESCAAVARQRGFKYTDLGFEFECRRNTAQLQHFGMLPRQQEARA